MVKISKSKGFFYRLKLFYKKLFSPFKIAGQVSNYWPILLAILMISTCLIAVFFVDINNIWNISYELRRNSGLYTYLFFDFGPIQLMQATFLGLISLTGLYLYNMFNERKQFKERNFWGLVFVAFILMLIEDVASPRHYIVNYTNMLNIPRELVEGPFYFLIALPFIVAILRYRDVVFSQTQTRKYLTIGLSIYAVAVGFSLFREFKIDFYQVWGTKLTNIVTGGLIPGYGLMDLIVEESMELIASSFILGGILSYLKQTNFY